MDALGYVHGRDIVHRDVKPLNIFISSGGEMKLGDLGLALSTRRSDAITQARRTSPAPAHSSHKKVPRPLLRGALQLAAVSDRLRACG